VAAEAQEGGVRLESARDSTDNANLRQAIASAMAVPLNRREKSSNGRKQP